MREKKKFAENPFKNPLKNSIEKKLLFSASPGENICIQIKWKPAGMNKK